MRFTLSLDDLVLHERIYIISSGDLEGNGTFLFVAENNKTAIHFTWHVQTTKKWMNITAPILRPLFIHKHHQVMKQFAEGIAKSLDVKLLSLKNSHTKEITL